MFVCCVFFSNDELSKVLTLLATPPGSPARINPSIYLSPLLVFTIVQLYEMKYVAKSGVATFLVGDRNQTRIF